MREPEIMDEIGDVDERAVEPELLRNADVFIFVNNELIPLREVIQIGNIPDDAA